MKKVNNHFEYLSSKEGLDKDLLEEIKDQCVILKKNAEKDLFEINLFKNNGIAIIYSLSYISPFTQLDRIEKFLKEQSFKGEVIFDSLMSVGNSFNRFAKKLFLGEKLEDISKTPIFLTKEEFYEIRTFIGFENFYKENSYLLEFNNILSSTDKFLIKNDHL